MRLITLILLISFLSCENKSSESKKIIEKKTLNEPIQWVNYKSKKKFEKKTSSFNFRRRRISL